MSNAVHLQTYFNIACGAGLKVIH